MSDNQCSVCSERFNPGYSMLVVEISTPDGPGRFNITRTNVCRGCSIDVPPADPSREVTHYDYSDGRWLRLWRYIVPGSEPTGMTVADLVAALQDVDQSLPVAVLYDGMYPPLERVAVTDHSLCNSAEHGLRVGCALAVFA